MSLPSLSQKRGSLAHSRKDFPHRRLHQPLERKCRPARRSVGHPKYELGSQLARGVVPLRIGDLESSCRGQITKENRIPGAREVRLESKAIAGHWPVHGPFSPSCCSPPEPGHSAPGSGHSANTKAAVPFLAFSPQGSVVPALTGC